MRDLFRDGNFFRYFLADNLGKIADSYFFLFLAWVGLQQTGDELQVGLLLMANAIPRFVFMLAGGNLADKFPPHKIMRVNNIVQAVGITVILSSLIAGGSIPLLLLYVIAVIFGTVDAFSVPASAAAVPRLVKKEMLMKANSLIQGLEMASMSIGVLIVGVFLQMGNMALAAIINLTLYVLAAVFFYTVRLRFNMGRQDKDSEINKVKKGLQFVWRSPVLRANTILLAANNVAITGPVTVGLLLLVTQKLGEGPIAFSMVNIAFPVGVLVGTLLASLLSKVTRPGYFVLVSYLLTALMIASFAVLPALWMILIAIFTGGIVLGVVSVVSTTWMQVHTLPGMLGRVGAVTMMAALAFDPFSQGIAGVLAAWSIDGLFLLAGAFMLIMTVLVVFANPVLLKREELPTSSSIN